MRWFVFLGVVGLGVSRRVPECARAHGRRGVPVGKFDALPSNVRSHIYSHYFTFYWLCCDAIREAEDEKEASDGGAISEAVRLCT